MEELSSNKNLTTLRVRVVKVTTVIKAVTSPYRPLTPPHRSPALRKKETKYQLESMKIAHLQLNGVCSISSLAANF